MDRVLDTPRLKANGNRQDSDGKVNPGHVKTLFNIVNEHNRTPGVFDYNHGQNFYSHHAEVDQESYLVLGEGKSHYAQQNYENGRIMSEKSRLPLA